MKWLSISLLLLCLSTSAVEIEIFDAISGVVSEIARQEIADGEMWSPEESTLQLETARFAAELKYLREELSQCDCTELNPDPPIEIIPESDEWQVALLVVTSSLIDPPQKNNQSFQSMNSFEKAQRRVTNYFDAVRAGRIDPPSSTNLVDLANEIKKYSEAEQETGGYVTIGDPSVESTPKLPVEPPLEPPIYTPLPFGTGDSIIFDRLEPRTFLPTKYDHLEYLSALLLNNMLETSSLEEMTKVISDNCNDLEFEDQLKVAAMLTDAIPYSHARAKLDQDYNYDQRTLFDMLSTYLSEDSDQSGICGDIHSATNVILLAMNPDLQLYTMSYASPNNQHVVSVVVNPEEDQKLHIINYQNIHTTDDVDGTAGLMVPNGIPNIGTRVRLYKNENGSNGSVATLNTPLGELLQEISSGELMKRFHPDHYNSNSPSAFEASAGHSIDQGRELMIERGIKVIGSRTTAGEEVLTVLIHTSQIKESRNSGAAGSAAFSYSQVTAPGDDNPRYVAYLSTENIATAVIERKIAGVGEFRFGGYAGMRLDAEFEWGSVENYGLYKTGDGNFSIPFGADGLVKLGTTSFEANAGGELMVGLKEETRVFDLSYLPENSKLFLNSLAVNATVRQDLNQSGSKSIHAGYGFLGVGSSDEKLIGEVGSLHQLEVGYSGEDVNITFGYQTPGEGFSLIPGHERQVTGRFEASLNDFMDVFMMGNLTFDGDGSVDGEKSQMTFGARIPFSSKPRKD